MLKPLSRLSITLLMYFILGGRGGLLAYFLSSDKRGTLTTNHHCSTHKPS